MRDQRINFIAVRTLVMFQWLRLVAGLSPESISSWTADFRNGTAGLTNLTMNLTTSNQSTSNTSIETDDVITITSDMKMFSMDPSTSHFAKTSIDLSSSVSFRSDNRSVTSLGANLTSSSSKCLFSDTLCGYPGSVFQDITYTGGEFPHSCPRVSALGANGYSSGDLDVRSFSYFARNNECLYHWCRAQFKSIFPNNASQSAYTRVTSGSFFEWTTTTTYLTLEDGESTPNVSSNYYRRWGTSTLSGYDARWGGLWGPPCCDVCSFSAEPVNMGYWPPSTPGQPETSTLTISGNTYISPSIYLTFKSAKARNLCSVVGDIVPLTTFSFAPTDIWSLFPLPNATGTGIGEPDNYRVRKFDWNAHYSYLSKNCSSKSTPIHENLDYDNYDPCFPRLFMVNMAWTTLINPLWRQCAPEFQFLGFLDPPTLLVPQTALLENSASEGSLVNTAILDAPTTTTHGTVLHTEPAMPGSMPRPPIDSPSAVAIPPNPHDPELVTQHTEPIIIERPAWSKLAPTMNDNGNIIVGDQTLIPGQSAAIISGTPIIVGTDRAIYAGGTLVGSFPEPPFNAGGYEVDRGDQRNSIPGPFSGLVFTQGSQTVSAPFSIDSESRMVLEDGHIGSAGAVMTIDNVAWYVGANREVYSDGEVVATLALGSLGGGDNGESGGARGASLRLSMGIGDMILNAGGGEPPRSTETGETGDTADDEEIGTTADSAIVSSSGIAIAHVAISWILVCVGLLYGAL